MGLSRAKSKERQQLRGAVLDEGRAAGPFLTLRPVDPRI